MKKLIKLVLIAVMCFSLVACGGDNTQSSNKDESKNTVITVENWNNYLEIAVETSTEEGFLDYRVYFKAKEGVVISNETNTVVHFSYDLNKQHYTKENNEITLTEKETINNDYTVSYYMYGNQKEENYCAQIDNIKGSSWSFTDNDRWTIIPSNFVITNIEGTITVN